MTAIDVDRARPALSVIAAFLGPGQPPLLAQQVEQRRAGVDRRAAALAVDHRLDRQGAGLILRERCGRLGHCRAAAGKQDRQSRAAGDYLPAIQCEDRRVFRQRFRIIIQDDYLSRSGPYSPGLFMLLRVLFVLKPSLIVTSLSLSATLTRQVHCIIKRATPL